MSTIVLSRDTCLWCPRRLLPAGRAYRRHPADRERHGGWHRLAARSSGMGPAHAEKPRRGRYDAQHVSQFTKRIRGATSVAGKARKKQLARQRYERQAQRRAIRQARARRMKIIGTVVAVVVVAGGSGAVAMA